MATGAVRCPRCDATIDRDTSELDERGRPICAACPAVVVRRLEISPDLRRVLARLRELSAPTSQVAVRASKLAHVEAAIGSVLPDAIVAFVIAIGAPLDRVRERMEERALFIGARGDGDPGLAAAARRDLITFDRAGQWPVLSCGFRPTTARGEPPLVIWDWKSWTALPGKTPATLVDYLRGWYALGDSDRPPIDLSVPPSAEALAAFDPAVEDRTGIDVARRVQHPKFGSGTVLRDIDGKLEIDFDEGGVKVLMARFVTDVV